MSECGHPVNTMNDHIRHLKERLEAKEVECTLLAAHNRKLEEELRPFAEAYNRASAHTSDQGSAQVWFRSLAGVRAFIWDMDVEDFARAAEVVPATSPPPSAAAPGTT